MIQKYSDKVKRFLGSYNPKCARTGWVGQAYLPYQQLASTLPKQSLGWEAAARPALLLKRLGRQKGKIFIP